MLKIAKVIGLNSDIDAALTLIAQNGSGLHLFAVVFSSMDDAFTKTRQALSEAETIFFEGQEPVGERLEKMRENLLQTLSGSENLEMILSSVSEDEAGAVLYLLCRGEGLKAQIIRSDKKIDLCALSSGQLTSGVLEDSDRVVFATQSLFDFLGDDEGILALSPIEALEDEISLRLPEAQNSPLAAIIVEKEKVAKIGEAKPEPVTPDLYPEKNEARRPFKISFPTSRKFLGLLGILLLILAVGGTVYSFQQKKNSETTAAFERNFKNASDQFKEAFNQKDSDPALAGKSLAGAKTAIEEALKIRPKDSSALDLKKQIEENSSSILKIYQVSDIPLWLDLELIKKGFKAKNLSLSHGKMLVLDPDTKTLASIATASKAHQLLAGEEQMSSGRLASLNGSVAWVFSNKGIVKTAIEENKTATAIKIDEEWGNILDIYGFASNVYLLDQPSNQVWKYTPVEAGYSDKIAYFTKDTKADLSGARRMQIDSSVWILKSGGQILRFTQGVADYFSYAGLDRPIKDLKSFFVSSETDNLYLLDGFDKRLLVLDKKGNYLGQYLSDKFSSYSDLVVDEKGKKAYLLDGSKIYSMDLK